MPNLKIFAASSAMVPTTWMRAVDPDTYHVQADVVLVAATKKAAVAMLIAAGLSENSAATLVSQVRVASPQHGSVKALREAGVADGTTPGVWVYRSAQQGQPIVRGDAEGLPTVAHFRYREYRAAEGTGLRPGLYVEPVQEEQPVPRALKVCPNCESTKFEVTIEVVATKHAPGHGRLTLNDVKAVVVVGCIECSETIEVLDADDPRVLVDVQLPPIKDPVEES